ncbi:MAG: bifunctional metallophosphatase/5'-nucleotidase [Deltaproteobacteria bacterium]|nr:MAG: bifunctional metallophosphatase/5'-nucleotidase [Deltaproteobacteria bacterium]
MAAIVHREKRLSQRALYIDTGDVFQGAPVFNFGNGEPEFRWLATIPVDVFTLGNHEFDKGEPNLFDQIDRWVNYPLLAANYIFEDWQEPKNRQLGRYVQPYTIVNAKGLRIGIIGLGDIGSMYSITRGGNSTGITPVEANETVRAYVNFLSPAVDLIVIASHLGLSEDQELTNGHEVYFTADKDVSHLLNREQDPWVALDCPECRPGVRKYWVPGVRGIDVILGGHLHVLTRPPMVLEDPAGRPVVLEHPGAFAKYVTRLDFAVAVPAERYACLSGTCVVCDDAGCTDRQDHFSRGTSCTSDEDCAVYKLAPFGAEVVSHKQTVFPVDSIWCAEPRPDPYSYAFGDTTSFRRDAEALAEYCSNHVDARSRNLLEPYRVRMETDPNFILTQIYGFAPRTILRKNTGTGGDSELGNLTCLAMMRRKRVEAEFCVTNTLGIRDNLYAGLIDMEAVFNSFPFENTITVMYLSGREVQELFDYVTERSHGRGCQSQAQIAGASFVMNCGQVKRNDSHYPCSAPEDCCPYRPEICEPDYQGTARWECNQGSCYAHPAEDIMINGRPLDPDGSYKMATNDYIARGGSGFEVLRRNITKIDTGIAMRDALLELLRGFPSCRQLLENPDPNSVDAFSLSYCLEHSDEQGKRSILVRGACSCGDVLDFADGKLDSEGQKQVLFRCTSIDTLLVQFCRNPLEFPIVVGHSDGRITRKVN